MKDILKMFPVLALIGQYRQEVIPHVKATDQMYTFNDIFLNCWKLNASSQTKLEIMALATNNQRKSFKVTYKQQQQKSFCKEKKLSHL